MKREVRTPRVVTPSNNKSQVAQGSQPKFKHTRVISYSTSPSTTTVESCYSIESLHSSSTKSRETYYAAQECRHWKVLVILLLLTIACGFVILVTARSPQEEHHHEENTPRGNNNSNTGVSSDVSLVQVPNVRFDYSSEPTHSESESNVLSEYVSLYKLPPPVDLDASSENVKSQQQHHHRFRSDNSRHHYYNTGVFRPKGSRLWDPHPQYIFHAFNKRFHLVLNQISKKHSLLIPGFKVTTHRTGGGGGGNGGAGGGGAVGGRETESWVSRDSVSEDEFEGCFYNGYVLGDLESSVAVSLCGGMTGHIRTSTGSYFIEPRHYTNSNLEHEIYQIVSQRPHDASPPELPNNPTKPPRKNSTTRTTTTTSVPKLQRNNLKITPPTYDYYSDEDYDSTEEDDEDDDDSVEDRRKKKQRKKRSLSTERYVELTVVTDQTMSRYHGDNLKHYVLTLLSIVALVYRDASIGNPVNIVLVNFHVLTDTDFSGSASSTNSSAHGTSASEMLRNFCKWQKEHNHQDDRHALHHDTALLLTRETICRNPWVGKCDTLGLAELGTMCDHYASCAIVQDNGLSAAFTIAHELGHVMNMPHDDDYKCQGFVSSVTNGNELGEGDEEEDEEEEERNGGKSIGGVQHYVMSRMLDHNTYPWAWSRCSRHFLTEFLDAGHGYCLEDKPDSNLLYNDDENSVDDNTNSFSQNGIQQPGEVFSEHKQCEFVFGPNSQLCSYMPPCRRLWCTNHGGPESEESEGCRTQHMPWADGTRCGANKWCQRGACVLKDLEKLKIINGGWGNWQDYGECSRECGGGVRKSYRECDNPKPKNGGKYCVGPRVRYESCNTFECPGNSTTDDFRGSQCGTYNGDNFNIHGLPEDVVWVPKYNGISPKDRCKLFCRVQGSSSYYLLKEKVIDGTPCGIDTFDVCVNGACLPAGCDRRLHSTKTLDICGVCGGDGSTCTTSQGSYNSTKYGYNAVFRIPSGASNIDIRQRSYDNTARDDNYLALMDPIANEYVLNGHFVVSMFRKTLHYGGSVLEYSGSDQIVERINSSSRPIKRDLEVRVLSVGKLKPPDIVFQYVISSDQGTSTVTEQSTENYVYSWVGKRNQNEHVCSSVCSGVSVPYKNWECVRRSGTGNQVVEATYCGSVAKPTHHPQACNTHCTISYRLACPESCVHARNHTTECVRTLHSTNTTQRISEKYCVNGGVEKPDPPDCVSECRNRKARWRYTQWSECSVSVGRCSSSGNSSSGYQMRNVWCQRFNWRSLVEPGVDNFEVVEDKDCEGEKPVGRRACRVGGGGGGGICGEWKIDQWSPCSTSCGPGRTRALYACVLKTHSQTQILPPDYCVHVPKPIVERPCEKIPCASYSTSNWSECDCTTSTESRNMTCVINEVQSELTECDRYSLSKPDLTRACVTLRDCEAFEYNVSNWTADCRLYNGKYYRYRVVSCDKSRCTGVKPESMRECGEWKVESSWTGCNGSCSVGVEVRAVGCYVSGVRVASDLDCSGIVGVTKPLSERKCFHNCRGAVEGSRLLRSQEGVGGGVSERVVTVDQQGGPPLNRGSSSSSSSADRYWYNINNGRGSSTTTEGPSSSGGGVGGATKTAYKWSTGNWMKCTRMTTPKSSSSSCVPSTTHPRSFKKHRQVKCVAETSTPSRRVTTVPTAYCITITPAPEPSINCTDEELTTLQPCPIWLTSEWTECTVPQNTEENCSNQSSSSILHGVKTRTVVCVHDTTNNTVQDSACEAHVPKPEGEEKCVVRGSSSRVCNVTYTWRVGNWSGCVVDGGGVGGKKKCGQGGRKVRSVECLRTWGVVQAVVGEEFCSKKNRGRRVKLSSSGKPKTERDCVRACNSKEKKFAFKWVAGEWSNCSRPCGGYGLRSRRVSCHRTNPFDWTDPDPLPPQISQQQNSTTTAAYCTPPKPKEHDYCMVSESCDTTTQPNNTTTYSWSSTDYSTCGCPAPSNNTTLTPTTSFQKRKVFCKNNATGQKSPARYCASTQKPKRKRKCACNAYGTCSEMRTALMERFIEVQDGEYSLTVGGKSNVRVYCHGMTDLSTAPKEYVTVNENNNWSEIYDKRLIRPETCPRNGSRLATCECVNDRNRRVGVTRWKRLRVNVTNLRIDVDDHTFSSSTQDQIQYATAGDCYSSTMACPQGRFSIDLRSSSFSVSPVTTWTSTGHRATMRVVRKSYGNNNNKHEQGASQFVQGKCGGYCGTCAVSTGVGLRVDIVT